MPSLHGGLGRPSKRETLQTLLHGGRWEGYQPEWEKGKDTPMGRGSEGTKYVGDAARLAALWEFPGQ